MDEYLKILLDQIRCKKAWPYIKQELQDHMEDQIEANMSAGMNYEQAEKEAVRDMGDPVETGISLDSIHKPQIAWKLLVIIAFVSMIGVLIHTGITGRIGGNLAVASDRYIIHVMIGFMVMMFLYLLDYTVLARFSKIIAAILLLICFVTLLFGGTINGSKYFLILPGNELVPVLMLFYIPIYGAVIYKYHGQGYKGLMKTIAWMLIPVALVCRLPAITIAGVMLISMLIMLTIAVQKGWFTVQRKKVICGLWVSFLTCPVIVAFAIYLKNGLAEYQMERVHAVFSGESFLHSFWKTNKLVGKSGTDITENLPKFNTDYILTYLSSVYGTIAAILLCCIVAVLILAVFNTAMKQKNQLGMMMGCGCGIVFLVSFLLNVLENIGIFPQTTTFLPFLSAGGSYIIVSYGLMGIVLSTYRYKNIYPRHLKINIGFDKDKVQQSFYMSKMLMEILREISVVLICVKTYYELCNTYMNIPLKIVTIVLAAILISNIKRIILCNEIS